MVEITKPPVLAARGGAWFRSGTAELHLGVEEPFVSTADPVGNRLELLEPEQP